MSRTDRQLRPDRFDVGPSLAWTEGHRAGREAERERIRARVFVAATKTWHAGEAYIGPPHWTLCQFIDALLGDGDE